MSSRSKGASAEREVAVLIHQELQDVLEKRPQRNLLQTRDGGHDLVGLPGVALEVKRVEQLSLAKWWAQACRQADDVGLLPVLVYRQSRQPWCFVLPWGILRSDLLHRSGYFMTNLEGFGVVYRDYLLTLDQPNDATT